MQAGFQIYFWELGKSWPQKSWPEYSVDCNWHLCFYEWIALLFCVEDLKTQVGDRKPPGCWSAFPENLLRKGGGRGETGAYKMLFRLRKCDYRPNDCRPNAKYRPNTKYIKYQILPNTKRTGRNKLLQYQVRLQTSCKCNAGGSIGWTPRNWREVVQVKIKKAKNKPHNFLTAFGTYRWRKMSAPSTWSLGPWIFLWSCLATPITGLNLQYSLIVFLFSTTLCLEPLPS